MDNYTHIITIYNISFTGDLLYLIGVIPDKIAGSRARGISPSFRCPSMQCMVRCILYYVESSFTSHCHFNLEVMSAIVPQPFQHAHRVRGQLLNFSWIQVRNHILHWILFHTGFLQHYKDRCCGTARNKDAWHQIGWSLVFCLPKKCAKCCCFQQ